MEIEDGVISVYRVAENGAEALTDFGTEKPDRVPSGYTREVRFSSNAGSAWRDEAKRG